MAKCRFECDIFAKNKPKYFFVGITPVDSKQLKVI